MYGLEPDSLRARQIKAAIEGGKIKPMSFQYHAAPPPTRLQRVWRTLKFHVANVFSLYWGQLWVPLAWQLVKVLGVVAAVWGVARYTRRR